MWIFFDIYLEKAPLGVFEVQQHLEALSPPAQAVQAEVVGWPAGPPTACGVLAPIPDLPKHLQAHSDASPLALSTPSGVSPLHPSDP